MKRAVLVGLGLLAGSCSFSANVAQFCQKSGSCVCDAGSCCALSGSTCDNLSSPCCPGLTCAGGACVIGSFDGGGNPPDAGPTPDSGSPGSDAGNPSSDAGSDAGFLCAVPDAGCTQGSDCCTQSCTAQVCDCSPAQGTCTSDLDCCGVPSNYCDAGQCVGRVSQPPFCNGGNADCNGLASGACCYAYLTHVTCCERCPTGLATCVCQCQ